MLWNTIAKSNLLLNIFSLSFVRFSSYIFPIIITPIVSRALGTDGYGQYLFFISITNYIFLIVDWGFQFYGPRSVSLATEDNRMVIAYDIIASKILLALLTCFALIILSFFYKYNLVFLLLLILSTVSFAANPLFYLHGIEKIYISAGASFIVRFLSLPFFLLMIKDKTDLTLVISIYVLSQLMISIFTFVYMVKNGFNFIQFLSHILNFSFFKTIRRTVKIFFSNALVTIYSNTGIIMLGFLASNEAISIYGSSMLFISASKSLLNPISLALYPKSAKMNSNNKKSRSLIFKVQLLVGTILGIVLFFGARILIFFFFGNEFEEAIFILKLLSPIPILVAVSNFYGVQILIAKGKEEDFMKTTLIGALLTIFLLAIYIPQYAAIGAAIGILSCEFVVAIGSFIYGYRFLQLEKIESDD